MSANKKIRVAINGYGRIGRGVHRHLVMSNEDIEVVAINSGSPASSHAYLLKHDSLYGLLDAEIEAKSDDCLMVNGRSVKVFQTRDPKDIGWAEHDVDVVIEATGKFTNYEDASPHIEAGAKKVLVTAPCKDDKVQTIVLGVNDKDFDPAGLKVVSNASCTTNCLAPVMKILELEYGVEEAFATTIHAFTLTQNLLDSSNPGDFRRARATTESIIPTSTGAMISTEDVIPSLKGKIDGMAFRVPIPTVSVVDTAVRLKKNVSVDELNEMFRHYESEEMKGILGTSDEPLVSVDFKMDTRSSIVDLLSTKVVNGNFVKVVSWYDNEWGYISRVVDLIRWIMG